MFSWLCFCHAQTRTDRRWQIKTGRGSRPTLWGWKDSIAAAGSRTTNAISPPTIVKVALFLIEVWDWRRQRTNSGGVSQKVLLLIDEAYIIIRVWLPDDEISWAAQETKSLWTIESPGSSSENRMLAEYRRSFFLTRHLAKAVKLRVDWLPMSHDSVFPSETIRGMNKSIPRSGVVRRGRRSTASTYFIVWNNILCTFYEGLNLWPCRRLASTHFFWRPLTPFVRTTPLILRTEFTGLEVSSLKLMFYIKLSMLMLNICALAAT